MGSEEARNLRRQGIAAAKAGNKDQARGLLQQSLRLDPRNEAAWIWLASVARDQRERYFCIQKLLEVNPQNEVGLKAMREMSQAQSSASPQAAEAPERRQAVPLQQAQPAPAPASPAAPQASNQPGIPLPDQAQISNVQEEVDFLLREYRAQDVRLEGIEWVKKARGRAGERDSLYLGITVWAGVIALVAALLIGSGLVVWNTPSLRGIVFAPTETPTFTPTPSPTFTPGFTPTPSATPENTSTPRPTIDASITPGGTAVAQATAVYPEISSRHLINAVNSINRGQFADALPTLAREREITEFSFDPSPYYYEALALIGNGDLELALGRMQEAEGRLNEAPTRNFRPLVDLGFAQVHFALAERALAEDEGGEANDQLDAVELRAQSALERDPRLVDAYILLAKRYRLDGLDEDALVILDQGLEQPGLSTDTKLLVERGEVYYDLDSYHLAEQDAFMALYIDPTVEEAYLLQIKSVMAMDDPGLAVIYSNRYLFYYPGSAEGFKLRGDARVIEGNLDLALYDYTQALTTENENAITVETLLARAAIYRDQRRYRQAEQDLTRALRISNDPEIRGQRMLAAYLAGNRSTALSDGEALLGEGVLPDAQIELIQAQVMIDDAGPNDTEEVETALDLINTAIGGLSGEQQASAREYRARAQFMLEQYDDALANVNEALGSAETGSRRFLRGQIFEALERPEDALREYEWVVTWSEIYPYPFVGEARRRYTSLQSALAEESN